VNACGCGRVLISTVALLINLPLSVVIGRTLSIRSTLMYSPLFCSLELHFCHAQPAASSLFSHASTLLSKAECKQHEHILIAESLLEWALRLTKQAHGPTCWGMIPPRFALPSPHFLPPADCSPSPTPATDPPPPPNPADRPEVRLPNLSRALSLGCEPLI
jgi:hypothetical protein